MLDEHFESCFLAGQRRDFIHHGTELQGIASARLQIEGNRVVIMALAEEVRTLLNSSDEEACGCVLASQGCSVALSLVRSRFDFLQRTNEK